MKHLLIFWTILIMLPGGAFGDASPRQDKSWQFDVFLGDKAIGYHHFQATDLEDGLLMRSDAEFQVKVLFFTAFDYMHTNSEVWRDGCLQSIDATTNANGKKSEVLGKLAGDTFVVETGSASRHVAECVASFAYWNRDLLQREQLLNAQTGEYVEVESKSLPQDRLKLGNNEVTVDKVQLKAKGVDIVVSYATDTGAWVALDSTLKNGRTLSYRLSNAEAATPPAIATNSSDSTQAARRQL